MSEGAYHALKAAWRDKINDAVKDKAAFQREANMCMRFYDGPYKFLYGFDTGEGFGSGEYLYTGSKRIPRPSMSTTVNKVAEGVQLFGPSLYSRNPVCKVNPRKPPEIPQEYFGDVNDPQQAQMALPILQQLDRQNVRDTIRSVLLSGWLNYLPTAINLKQSSRRAIDECIIKGGGVLWLNMQKPGGGQKMPVAEYDTLDHLHVDPDCEKFEDAKWIARRFCKPVWQVEHEKGLPKDTLKGNESSEESHGADKDGALAGRKKGKTNDLLVYWGIWSKMGMGGLLKGVAEIALEVDRYGQYVYLEVCDCYEYPLNVPEEIWENEEEVQRRVQWETPFWCDAPTSNGWPMELLVFHESPNKKWPVSHFKPALGELMFINWAYSFLISKVQMNSRDFIACMKGAAEELKSQILEGPDFTLLEIEANLGRTINEVVQFMQIPPMNKDILTVIQWVEKNFDKRVGLNELLYGIQDTQDRSATETKSKENFANLRPQDMANSVEDWMSGIFRKLALMSRWHMGEEDITTIFGPVIGRLWGTHVASADVDEIIHQIEYRIEAGSAQKKNKAKDSEDANALMQNVLVPLLQRADNVADYEGVNAILAFYTKAMDMSIPGLKLNPPPPPDPNAPPSPEVQQMQMEMQMLQQEAQVAQAELQQESQAREQEMRQDEEAFDQEMRHMKEKNSLDLKIAKEKAAMQKKLAEKKAKEKPKASSNGSKK